MLDEEARKSHRVPIAILLTLQLVVYLGGMATAGAEEPTADPSATGSATPAPTIVSDKDDYAPGEIVTLTGEHWQPGEAVHIRVDDDQERTWSHDADVTAGEEGRFTYQFALPTHFVAVYTVVATGAISGVAVTSFTDGTVEVRNAATTPAGVTATYTLERWTNASCTGAPAESKTFSITGPGGLSGSQGQVSTGNSESIRLTLVSVTGGAFVKWTRDAKPPLSENEATDWSPAPCESVGSPTQWLIFGHFVAANQAPVATDDTYSTDEDTALNVQAPGVLDNDADADGDVLSAVHDSGPSHGALTPNTDGSFTYTPDEDFCGSDSFTYKANDGTADSNVATVSISVNCVNDPPTIEYTEAPATVDESTTTEHTYTFSITDPDSSAFEFAAGYPTCGTGGTLVTGSPDIIGNTGTFKCRFPDGPASSEVKVKVQDGDGAASNEISQQVTVKNVAPVVTLTGDTSVNEGDTKTYSFTTSDPGDEVFSLDEVSCGTGGIQVGDPTFSSATGAGSFDCRFPDGPASTTVSVTVSDDDDGSGFTTIEVDIANVAPEVTLTGPTSADEGQTVSYSYTFTDPGADTWTASVSCGANGTVSNEGFDPDTKSGSFDCTWPDNFEDEEVKVTVSDDDDGSGFATIEVDIANVAPVVTSASFDAPSVSCAERTVTLTVEFTDPGTDDTWLATIDWGDGSPVETVDPATSPIIATHTYALAGVYTANIVVADDDGEADSETAQVTVNYTIVGDGFLPPINNTGHGENPSVFKYGSTIPVKVKVQDCDGSYPDTLAPKVFVQKVNGGVPVDGELEPYSTSAADTGNTMRFTGPPDLQYIYNLASKSFASDPTSTWLLIVRIPATGQEIKTTIGFKK